MPLLSYEEQGLFFNKNFLEAGSAADSQTYRGELVITEGELADDSGRRKAPVCLLREAVLLSVGDKLTLMAGGLDTVSDAPKLLARYGKDLGENACVVLLAPNLYSECKTEIEGISCIILTWEAMAWSQLSEEVRLEKSDFKGQSAAEKVETLMEGLVDYKPSSPFIPFDEVLANATEVKRETHGAI